MAKLANESMVSARIPALFKAEIAARAAREMTSEGAVIRRALAIGLGLVSPNGDSVGKGGKRRVTTSAV